MRRHFLSWLVTLFAGWCLAWLLFKSLEPNFPSLKDPLTATLWWTAAKLLIWIAPIFLFSRFIPLPLSALRLGHLRRVPLAIGASICWVSVNALGDWLLGRTPAPAFSIGVVSACLFAPFAEELLFRGFAFAWLEQLGFSFWKTNLITAALFALLHLPGWAATQGLGAGLVLQLVHTAALGFIFGLLRKGDGSLWAPITLHFANNLWSQGLLRWLLSA